MAVLSIQSSVVHGHVGNSAAVFALQRLGVDVLPIDTVTLAHHPGRGGLHGHHLKPEEFFTLIDALDRIGVFKSCEAVLSGYLGDAALGPTILDVVARVKRANSRALYLCDPVMGERQKGTYVRPGIPEFFRTSALPLTDILMPNAFELGLLADCEVDGLEAALSAAGLLLARGPHLVVATGIVRKDRRCDWIGALAVTAKGAWLAESPFVEAPASGAGDLFAAVFLGRYLKGRDPAKALAHAVSTLHAVMTATRRKGGNELALIAAQAAIAAPKRLFKAEKMR
ncbi:MAG TPA: pyridoxal kinase PdxY [Alphaproteobacteria bacterium]|nr:pyridoxal kinase PdxY [Alphaproteobacteria bacterium]